MLIFYILLLSYSPFHLLLLYTLCLLLALAQFAPHFYSSFKVFGGFPGGSDGKESACNVGDLGLIPGLGRSHGEGNGYPLQYSCLENPWTEEPGRLQSIMESHGLHSSALASFTQSTVCEIHPCCE